MKKVYEWSLIETNKTNGITKVKCPICTPTRKNKSDRSLYVNLNSGVAKCYNCEALFFRESIKKEVEKNYTLPNQDWRNYTNLSDSLVKYCESRGIQQFTLQEFGVTEEKYYQPALGKEVNNIVFNYFESDIIVNKKYRTGNKHFTQTKNGKPIFFNINNVLGASEVYICEGEFDALAIAQIGLKAVISVPNGANDNDNYWMNSEKYLKDVKKFFIATDNDEKGNDLAERIAQRLGRYRCERVLFEGKDANDDLKSGVLEKTIYNTKKYPVSGTFTVFDLYDGILNLYENGLPETLYPKHKCFGSLKDNFSIMRGHLIVSTGIPSHGKSNFTDWYILNLINDYNLKASWFSPEHSPMELYQTSLIQKVVGKNFWKETDGIPRVSKLEVAKYAEWANEKVYLTGAENGETPNWDWILNTFKEQMFNYGIDIFVIDAFNKVILEGSDERREINKVLTKLTSFAQSNNVIIFLVAHPTKMKKDQSGIYEVPNLYDVSGSSDFRNQTHNGFCVYRYFGENEEDNKTDFINLKTKFSFQGNIGSKESFKYHVPTGRYYVEDYGEPLFSFLEKQNKKEEIKEDILPIINPSEAFDDVPF
jgi:twinkle protein